MFNIFLNFFRSNYAMGYEESIYQQQQQLQQQLQQQQQHYAPGGKQVIGVDYPDSQSNNHTPSRNGGSRLGSARPSQPPPAPPSANNSNTR